MEIMKHMIPVFYAVSGSSIGEGAGVRFLGRRFFPMKNLSSSTEFSRKCKTSQRNQKGAVSV